VFPLMTDRPLHNFITLLGRIFSFAARCVVRCRLVSVAVQPGSSSFSTAATALSRTVAAAQYSIALSFFAKTT
jgi:hypothetical protein